MRGPIFAVAGALLVACAGPPSLPPSVPLLQLDEVRKAPLVLEAHTSAEYKEAERLRELAIEAERKGDAASAEAYASTSRAWFERAALRARLDRAERDESAAKGELGAAEAKAGEAKGDTTRLETELTELQKRLVVAKELRKPVLDKADGDRAKARGEAATTLGEEAALLCQAAELVGAKGESYAAAVKQLDHALEQRTNLPEAMAAREGCLRALGDVKKEDAAKASVSADTLFDDLSRAAWLPVRDERGIVVTLEGDPPEDKLKALARVALAHPGFLVQIVGHDEAVGKAASRIDVAKRVLSKEGVAEASFCSHDAGPRLPIVHPRDAQAKVKNRRLEVVFVSKGN